MSLPEAKVTARRVGREGQPIVVIDDFSGQVDRLLAAGFAANYEPGGAGYPGIRSWAEPSYLDIRRDLMMQIVQRVFGFTRGIRCEVSTFSLVTQAEETLVPLQCIPHYDRGEGDILAVMHYLLGEESGGTAFYRHRRTGFETITEDRKAAYETALEEDEREYGLPPQKYYHGDSDRYELIEEIQARPDRLILYRGRMLHSGVIPDPALLSSDPRKGRLTINMFMRGPPSGA